MIYIVYDLEAACWRGRPPGGVNEIIEIGALKINMFGENVGVFSRFVRPTVNPVLSGFCKSLTNIRQEDVDLAQLFKPVVRDFIDWIDEDDYALCCWGKNDKQMWMSNLGLHKMETKWLDSHIDLKKQYHHIRGYNKLTGLKATVKREGFEFDGVQHRAITDAENLAKIFIKYIDEWIV